MGSSLQTALNSVVVGPCLAAPDTLGERLIEQQQIIAQQSMVIAEQQKRLALLEEQIRLLREKRFGPSSEKSHDQLSLFDEDESPLPASVSVPEPEDSTQKLRRRGRQGLSPDLPRQRIYLRLSEQEKAGASETFPQSQRRALYHSNPSPDLRVLPGKGRVHRVW